ncbi:MAG: polysaccharide deacetylase family protein [Dysgonomonas sp.]
MKKSFITHILFFLCVCINSMASTSSSSLTTKNSTASVPNLSIKGENYTIEALVKNAQVFSNRTNMFFDDIPSAYTGWKYTKTNANSSYLPGPLPSLKVKANAAGYIYAMVANYEKPAVCTQWATDNGWELMSDQVLSYGSTDAAKLYVYRKSCVADVWVDIVQPATFSGAIIIAPEITDANLASRFDAVPVNIEAFGWMETSLLSNGTVAYANRSYVFSSVKSEIAGLYVTRYNGGTPPKLRIKAKSAGNMYIAISNAETGYKGEDNGWTKVDGLNFSYNDPTTTTFTVYTKTVAQDEILSISTSSWQGVLVLSSNIEYTNMVNFTPPPGVVIHNSKAVTKKFVGSPSIVVLNDGTYLASHDYFGGIISDAFVYKSTDKGKSWSRIAEIKTLNWAKLFTRGNELYLLGVAPKGTMGYGNVVILRSDDGGYTWTTPTNSTNGLLMNGYYTCAPTPVLFHKGKIWKAMENQGTVGGWGPFGAFMMSVDENADLMNAANWTFSNELQYVKGAVDAWTWLEGNAVIAKDGSIVDILRLHYDADDKAGIIKISDDGTTATFDPQTGISNLPGALKKFTINYDSISNRYWTLSSYVLPEDRTKGITLERVRNTIVLAWSEDLINWTIKDIMLHNSDITHHGFQYLDWLFDGNDIIAVSRTASDDETGQADSQHNANYLTFHRFKNFRYETSTSANNGIVPKRWFKNAKSAIALTFDDGFKAHYDYAYPILQANDIPATFFVNSGNLVNKGQTQKERYGYWEDFKTMSDNGYEVASHSLTHPNLTTASYDVLIDELTIDKQNIETNIGKSCYTTAYPSCLRNTDVDNVAASLFIAGRQCGELSNAASLNGTEWYAVNSDILSWTYPRSLDNEHASATSLKAKIESEVRANRKFGVLCIHEVLPFDLLSTSSTYEIATTEWLTEMCEYLVTKRASGDIWPTTFSNVVRYAQERDNLRILKLADTEDLITYDFTTWLDPSIFNLPVTVDVTIPGGWERVKCHFNDSQIQDSIYTPKNGIVTLDIIPDKHILTITKEDNSSIGSSETSPKIEIYPNPVHDILSLKGGISVNATCEIYDAQGICKIRTALSTPSVNVGQLAPGIYILKLKSKDKETFSSKFIKK